jgi:hypothetical protein
MQNEIINAKGHANKKAYTHLETSVCVSPTLINVTHAVINKLKINDIRRESIKRYRI